MANRINENQLKLSLKGYYDSLPNPVTPKRQLINDIMVNCNVVETTAFNWVRGRSKPDDPKHIEYLVQRTGIAEEDLWKD